MSSDAPSSSFMMSNTHGNNINVYPFLAVQWLGLHASTAGGVGSTPGQGTRILAAQHGKKQTNKQNIYIYIYIKYTYFIYIYIYKCLSWRGKGKLTILQHIPLPSWKQMNQNDRHQHECLSNTEC